MPVLDSDKNIPLLQLHMYGYTHPILVDSRGVSSNVHVNLLKFSKKCIDCHTVYRIMAQGSSSKCKYLPCVLFLSVLALLSVRNTTLYPRKAIHVVHVQITVSLCLSLWMYSLTVATVVILH